MRKILLVDDDPVIHTLVSAIVHLIGDLELVSAFNGREALEKARAELPALIISDVAMPDMDGLTLCRSVRADAALAATPVLMLTARGETRDKYSGFSEGADDYLVKPFDATELQFRIKALLRRASTPPSDAGRLGGGRLTLDTHRYSATLDGHEIRLTGSEFAILRYLVAHPGEVVSVEALLTEALDYPARLGNPQVIHTHVKNIRAKVREAGAEPTFLTSSRRGYSLASP